MMVDPGFAAGFIGYGITKSLDEVLKWLKQSLLFPKEYLELQSRVVRIRPMVEAIEQNASPTSASHQPEVGKWVDDLTKLLDDLKKLLELGSAFQKGRLNEPLKKRKFVADLAKLSQRFDALLRDGVFVTLVKIDRVLAKESADETADYLENLSQLLQTTADDQASVTQRNHDSIMEVLHKLAKKVDDIGYMQHLVQGLGIPDQQWIGSTSAQAVNRAVDDVPLASLSQAPQPELVSQLESLSSRRTAEGSIIRNVSVAPSHSAAYRVVRGVIAVNHEDGDADDDVERGSVVGGYEVETNCKIRLTMEAGEQRYFYVVTFDSSNPEPQLYHPRTPLAKNQLRKKTASVYQRIFPSHSDDLESWKLVKATALLRDEVERCFVYILFSRSRLEPDGRVATIGDVDLKLNAAGSWRDEEEVLVECLRFDVK